MSMYLGKFHILGVSISACNYDYVLKKILEAIKNKRRLLIAPIATHPIMLARQDKNYRNVLNSYDLAMPDSFYLKSSIKFLYGKSLNDRVYGPELFLRICKIAELHNLSIFLYGNNVKKLLKTIHHEFPHLKITGTDITGTVLNQNDIPEIMNTIDKKADIICIGIGSPLQHYVGKTLAKLNKPIITVGAAFDFISKAKPQAPVWMQKNGLEWLYRLLQEPKRLWKRYLFLGPHFLILVLLQKFAKIAGYKNYFI